jgi:hypothetical protein
MIAVNKANFQTACLYRYKHLAPLMLMDGMMVELLLSVQKGLKMLQGKKITMTNPNDDVHATQT